MDARMLHFYRSSGSWTLLHTIDEAIPISNSLVPSKPTAVLSIGQYPQGILKALQSAMRQPEHPGWKVHDIGKMYDTPLPDGSRTNAVNVIIVKEMVPVEIEEKYSKTLLALV
ncbi:MAG: hypothetical protein Q9168_003089 [Polycauliona sp. 1 TL-2023]